MGQDSRPVCARPPSKWRVRRGRVITVALALGLVGLLATQVAGAAPAKDAVKDYVNSLQRGAAKIQHDRQAATQEDREEAAARLELQQRIAALNIDGIKAAAVPTPQPGGVPDYFGSANWAFSPPLRKFVDSLPLLGPGGANNLGQFIPVGHPDTKTYPGCDYYEIELRQFSEKMHSDLQPTTLRGYVQVNNGTDPNTGLNTVLPDPIHQLGPFIVAQKDRPVRIKFVNKLPTGEAGDLFLPVDTTVMGAGNGPLATSNPTTDPALMRYQAFRENRATIHLHGGKSPWISDGTVHQWTTPAGENTAYPKGVGVKDVPDMPATGPGELTFYYTNQQSARLMFYHDHSWGITRLNVYAGEAAGYVIQDETEKQLIQSGTIPGPADTIPLVVQDKSFVVTATVRVTDPTWNWGTGAKDPVTGVREPKAGDLWYPHVYSPAQNPADLSGMNAYGRWHYGPWFWPPTTGISHPPTSNPYYVDPITTPGQNDLMPDIPNPSMAGEAFMDTPIVNGTAFPKTTVQPKPYRLRILNASSDRFWNLQMYVADSATQSADARVNTEVKMVPATFNATYPVDWPTDGREGGVPDPATMGPDWIQIGTEGGFLPKPAIVPQQPVTWNMDPTTFNMGNVDLHSLLLGPAERADVIVDFSQYAGKTLIVYNDAPAAFPARDPRLDYYTGAPDLSDTGGYGVNGKGPQVGFGPNTRTVMQINVSANGTVQPFDLAKLEAAFATTGTTDGVFKKSQAPIIVPDARYNSAYNGSFVADPYARIFDFKKTFRTLSGATMTLDFKPKAIQDEMGEAFDPEYGRMMGKLGLERIGTNAANQNFILQNYIDPATENVKPEMEALTPVQGDGTQIWRITHNGVDTHPLHFHLFDVQVLNRVGWDNGVRPPDDNELGWKETVRVSPLEDTIVALRPTIPKTPWGQPDSIRLLNPSMPEGDMMGFTNIDTQTGAPLAMPVMNVPTNFGWEYMWHCHILSHEEMDMMRPIVAEVARSLAATPSVGAVATAQGVNLTWTDGTPWDAATQSPASTLANPAGEVGFLVQRAVVSGGNTGPYSTVATAMANQVAYTDGTAAGGTSYRYRIVAFNAAGNTTSTPVLVGATAVAPDAPTGLSAAFSANPNKVALSWTDNALNEANFRVEKQVNGGAWNPLPSVPALAGTGTVTFNDTTVVPGATQAYRVRAENPSGNSTWSNTATVVIPDVPAAPSSFTGTATATGVKLDWVDNATNEADFTLQRRTGGGAWATIATIAGNGGGTGPMSYADTTTVVGTTYDYQIRANGTIGSSAWVATTVVVPAQAGVTVTRVTGLNQSQIAVEAAKRVFPANWAGVKHVILVNPNSNEQYFGPSLAGVYNAPVLIAGTNTLPSETAAVLKAMPTGVTVHMMGSTSIMSSNVYFAVRAIPQVGVIERIVGNDMYDYSAVVARRMKLVMGAAMPNTGFVINGGYTSSYTNVAAASALAVKLHYPIYFVTSTSVPTNVRSAMTYAGSTNLYILGATSLVSDTVRTSLGIPAGNRITGSGSSGLPVALANRAKTLGWSNLATVGISVTQMDANLAANLSGWQGGVYLPTGSTLDPQVSSFLTTNKAGFTTVYGVGTSTNFPTSLTTAINTALQ